MKTLLHASALLLTVIGLSSVAAAEELLEEKPVEKPGVSMRLPLKWQVDERSSKPLLLARAPERDKDAAGEFRAVLTITTDTGTKLDGRAFQNRASREDHNYRPEEKPETVKINGLEGVKFGGTTAMGPVKVRSRQYFLLHENRMYTLTFVCLASYWQSYAPAFDACAATFTVTPPPASPAPEK